MPPPGARTPRSATPASRPTAQGSCTCAPVTTIRPLGRFLTRDTWSGDPLGSQSQHRYSYVSNDPLTQTDPSGHCGIDAAFDLGFIGISAGMLVSGPEKDRGTNALALGADIVGLAIPCATGLGMLVRGGRVADNVADGLVAANRVAPDITGATTKIQRQMRSRGWTSDQINEAFEGGQQFLAEVKWNGREATRYVHPETGRSVVIDDASGDIIHVGGDGFGY